MNYVIIREIVYNIITIIAFIFAFFSFIIHVMKKTSSRIVNFNVIKKTPPFYANIRLRDFQIIEKRRFLINDIINEIVVLKNRLDYLTSAIVKTSAFIHNRRHQKRRNDNNFFSNIE